MNGKKHTCDNCDHANTSCSFCAAYGIRIYKELRDSEGCEGWKQIKPKSK